MTTGKIITLTRKQIFVSKVMSLLFNMLSKLVILSRLVKMVMLPKLIYRLSVITVRITADSFVETDRLILKLTWNCTGSRMAKIVRKMMNKRETVTRPKFRKWYKAPSDQDGATRG